MLYGGGATIQCVLVRGYFDTVGLDKTGFDDIYGASGGSEAIDGLLEGGRTGGDIKLPAIESVSNDIVSFRVNDQVVGSVKVCAKVVVQQEL